MRKLFQKAATPRSPFAAFAKAVNADKPLHDGLLRAVGMSPAEFNKEMLDRGHKSCGTCVHVRFGHNSRVAWGGVHPRCASANPLAFFADMEQCRFERIHGRCGLNSIHHEVTDAP